MTRRSCVILHLTLLCALAPHTSRAQSSFSQSTPPAAASSVPRSVVLNGQVALATGEVRPEAAQLTFALYANQQDGAPLWTEQQLVALDPEGRYSVILGSASVDGLPAAAFAAGTPRWLGVQIEGSPEQPRIMLLSVPYALKAADADTIGGRPASEFVVRASLFDTVKSTLKAEGYAPRPSNPTTSVPGVLAVFTDASNSLGNSNVVQNGSNIGINVSPAYPLHVFGATGGPFGYQTLRLDNPHLAGSSFTLGPTFPGAHVYSILSSGPASALGAGFLSVYDEGAGQFRLVIGPTGNVGIGAIGSAPTDRLDIIQTTPDAWSEYIATTGIPAGQSYGLVLAAGTNDQDISFHARNQAGGSLLFVRGDGRVGVGTTAPISKMHVSSSDTGSTSFVLENLVGQASRQVILSNYGSTGGGLYWPGLDSANTSSLLGPNLFVLRATGGLAFSGSSTTEHMQIFPNGHVSIGKTIPSGALVEISPTDAATAPFEVSRWPNFRAFIVNADGTVGIGSLIDHSTFHVCLTNAVIFAECSSAAEYVPTGGDTSGEPAAGELVSMAPGMRNPYHDEHAPFIVTKSAGACDPNLLGFLIDPASGADGKKVNEHYLPLAIYGYFPAKVTVENGAIRRGDPITSSTQPGIGMKSTGACRIIGYALDDADKDGTIQVFAHLSESAAPVVSRQSTVIEALRIENAALKGENTALDARVSAIERVLQHVLAQQREPSLRP